MRVGLGVGCGCVSVSGRVFILEMGEIWLGGVGG